MLLSKKFFSPLPTNDDLDPKERNADETASTSDDSLSSKSDEVHDEAEHKSFKTTLRDALQDWSNDDARDIEEDDSTPLRSGL